jgi:hypothetical protein
VSSVNPANVHVSPFDIRRDFGERSCSFRDAMSRQSVDISFPRNAACDRRSSRHDYRRRNGHAHWSRKGVATGRGSTGGDASRDDQGANRPPRNVGVTKAELRLRTRCVRRGRGRAAFNDHNPGQLGGGTGVLALTATYRRNISSSRRPSPRRFEALVARRRCQQER